MSKANTTPVERKRLMKLSDDARTLYMSFMQGWRDGAAIRAFSIEGDDKRYSAYESGYESGRQASRAASAKASELYGYAPLVIKTAEQRRESGGK